MENVDIKTVEFYGQFIATVRLDDGQPGVFAKELVENLNMKWEKQRLKLMNNPLYRSYTVWTRAPWDTQIREHRIIPITKVAIFLASINTLRIPEEKTFQSSVGPINLREHLLRYQLQCADVLYDFWHKTPRIPDIQVTGAHLQRMLPKFGKYLHKIATKDQIAELEDFIKSFVPAVLGVHYCDYDGRMIQATEGGHMVRMNHVEVAVLAIVESFLVDCMHIAIEEEYAIDDIFHMMETSMDQRLTQVRDLLSTYLSQQKRI